MTNFMGSEFYARAAGQRAVAAFNVITVEHAEGIVSGAEQADLPVILQLSENAIAYHGAIAPIAAAMQAIASAAHVDVLLHLDHITSVDLCEQATDVGFGSVMFDGAHHDFATNVELTRQVASWGKRHGIWVEAELGEVGGKDGAHAPGVRTDPAEAADFVAATGVDSLAVAVGSSHAMTDKTATLDLELISRLAAAVPVPLVLHGSSGVPDEQLTAAACAGIGKVNIGTALNIAYTGAIRAWLDENSGVDPRKYLSQAREAVAATVAHGLAVVAGTA